MKSSAPEVGRVHTLTVVRVDARGAWLDGGDEPLLLPRRGASAAVRPGERLTVFVFRDSAGELRASLKRPLAQMGEFALLTVRSVGPHGAFLDWGVEKDLLVPFSQQPERLQPGRACLVRVCLDREGRPYASARVEDLLEGKVAGLTEGDEVALVLWQFTELGAKVIVNHRFAGLLYRDELNPGMRSGDCLTGYVKRLRGDGKIDVTLRKVGLEGIEEARGVILAALRKRGRGFLPLHDASSPDAIREALGLSKKMFKRAVGNLYKEGLVEITGEGIRLKK